MQFARFILPAFCLFAGIMLLFILTITVALLHGLYLQHQSSGYTSTEAVVLSSDLAKSGRRGKRYSIGVEYKYEFDGVEHVSEQVALGPSMGYKNSVEASQAMTGYSAGSVVTAFVDPDLPSRAVLNNTTPTIKQVIITVLACTGINVFCWIIVWLMYSTIAEYRTKLVQTY